MQNNLAVGMLAHVDAGKTTLTEAMLFEGGCLERLGRVDHRDAFLDTGAMERKRGITIFSKQAILPLKALTLTLLDTPGHVDFSAEMERTLQILDYAILVVNGSDGVQGHTITLWQLLARYDIPTFLFVNKMDLAGTDSGRLLSELRERLHTGCISFSGGPDQQSFYEEIAMCDDMALDQFLENGQIPDSTITALIQKRQLFPCYFGSALKVEGIDALLRGLEQYTRIPEYPEEFAAKVYKVSRDNKNTRLTHLKITGGRLVVKAPLTGCLSEADGQFWTEKVNQIRIYSGEKYQAVEEALPGTVCAVTGLSHTYPGQGLGMEAPSQPPSLEPVLSFRVLLPEGQDPHSALRQLRQLEEEDPQLAISWSEQTQEIHLHLMGEVQLEVLSHTISERFGLEVSFDTGSILYRETISGPVIGMGHFEPLRHYAEVHLLLEPGPRGSGLRFASLCSEDALARNWQRLILTHLGEREHPGVLTGAPITDVKITLLAGRAHNKHTVGGDFRQATYRAIRQGLMQANSVLLEPWYQFQLEVPNDAVGRAMTDLQRISDDLSLPESSGGGNTLLTGSAPVAFLREYASEVSAYTHGLGRLACTFAGFAPCHNQEEAVAAANYDPLQDTENPADSIFCSHGTGTSVAWDQVREHMHLDSGLRLEQSSRIAELPPPSSGQARVALPELSLEQDKELLAIFERTYGPVRQRDMLPREKRKQREESLPEPIESRMVPLHEGPEYLLVDGYNIIHAWEDLNKVAQQSMDAARQILMDILSNYQGFRQQEVILVFDAYRVPGGQGTVNRYHNINVVYTKEAETADAYIEKVTYQIGKDHRVTVATSDGAVQLIILGHGALRMPPQVLRGEIEQANIAIRAFFKPDGSSKFTPTIVPPESI